MKKRITQEVVPGVVFFLLAFYMWIITPTQVPTTEKSLFTARTFPQLSLGIIMVCSALLVVNGLIRYFLEKKEQKAEEKTTQGNIMTLLEILGLVVVAVLTGNRFGLLISGLLLTFGFLLIYRDKKPLHYVIVAAVVIVFYYLFKLAFGLNLP